MDNAQARTDRIRALNDEVRHNGTRRDASVKWFITAGVHALGSDAITEAIAAVQRFDTFKDDNDPYHEHDFGTFDILGERIFWKIDYYDRTLEAGSPDPWDGEVTCRVLTIFLAGEH